MAYCEFGQKDCEYLDVVKITEEVLIMERLEGDQPLPDFSDSLAQAVENFKPTENDSEAFGCSPDACKVLKKAVAKAIMAEADQLNAEKELSEGQDGREN
jgi:hypothetical protein